MSNLSEAQHLEALSRIQLSEFTAQESKPKYRYAHKVNGRFAKIARTPEPATFPPMMPERKLVKSGIYRANGALCRFTGEYRDGLPVFRHHNYATFTSDSVETVEYSQVREYLTGLALNNENEGAMNQ